MTASRNRPLPQIGGRTIRSVYLAGKITGSHWRDKILDGWSQENHGVVGEFCGDLSRWRTIESAVTVDGHASIGYSGPYWSPMGDSGGHGSIGGGSGGIHDCGVGSVCPDTHGTLIRSDPEDVYGNIMNSLRRSDLVFAWIDSLDCYGTIYEVAASIAMGKVVVVAMPTRFNERELWITATGCHRLIRADCPDGAWNELWRHPRRSGGGPKVYYDRDHYADSFNECGDDDESCGEIPDFDWQDYRTP